MSPAEQETLERLGRWLAEPTRYRAWKSHGNDRDGYWVHLSDEPTFPNGTYSAHEKTLTGAIESALDIAPA